VSFLIGSRWPLCQRQIPFLVRHRSAMPIIVRRSIEQNQKILWNESVAPTARR